MANQISGIAYIVGKTLTIPTKDNSRTFTRRELVLDCSEYDRYTGERRENYVSVEFGGDKCALLDWLTPGTVVRVSFALRGAKVDGVDGPRYFTKIAGWAIETIRQSANNARQPQNATAAPAPAQPQPKPQPQPQQRTQPQPQAESEGGAIDQLPF